MATHAHELGHHTPPVVHLAEQAVAHARRTPSIIQSYAQAHLAVMQAHHDKHAALTTLTRAERLHARAHTTPGPFTAYPIGASTTSAPKPSPPSATPRAPLKP
ncbi:hypothetical protein [Streptomyces viridochromogenes]|uniref:Putative Regulator protein n=1 Tax=Streptomyces viridochromogenes Tue57 TaxID=1160705 RepID=L8PES7_STRVR|nr:hypothetical protein [Streptomyces viridochromogenes]ELS54910.1 putative Regulator protein [Streptomyces viridochromogenes Tue57]